MSEYLSFNLADDIYEAGSYREENYSPNIIHLCECLIGIEYTKKKSFDYHTTIEKDGMCAICGYSVMSVDKNTYQYSYVETSEEILIKKTAPIEISYAARYMNTRGMRIADRKELILDTLLELEYDKEKCLEVFNKKNLVQLQQYLNNFNINYKTSKKSYDKEVDRIQAEKSFNEFILEQKLIEEAKVLCMELDEMRNITEGKK